MTFEKELIDIKSGEYVVLSWSTDFRGPAVPVRVPQNLVRGNG